MRSAQRTSGTWSGSRDHATASAARRRAVRGFGERCIRTAIVTFPGSTTTNRAAVASAPTRRVAGAASAAAHASSATPLPSTQGRGSPSARGMSPS